MSWEYCPEVLFRRQQLDLAIMSVPAALRGVLRSLVHTGVQTCCGNDRHVGGNGGRMEGREGRQGWDCGVM
jgi:hypothetical protein